jgi:hypothetical protein
MIPTDSWGQIKKTKYQRMKRLKYLLAAVLVFLLAGCFEIHEQIDIGTDGKGDLTVNTDMSQMLEAMQNYLGKEEMEKQLPNKNLDTTVMMKTLMDSAKNVTAENKELVRDGTVHMKLDMKRKSSKAMSAFPSAARPIWKSSIIR